MASMPVFFEQIHYRAGLPEWDVLRVYWIPSQDKGSRLERLKGAQKQS